MKTKKRIYSLIEIGTKTAAGFLPGPISAAFNAVCDNVKESVLNKRAEKWKNDVVTRLEKLEVDYGTLVNNPSFATALIKTSELAIKTESDEKRKTLANALINSYLQKIEEDKIIIFLHLIEKYAPIHVRVLRYIHDERMQKKYSNNLRPTFIQDIILSFKDVDSSYLRKIINDLQNDFLIQHFDIETRQYIFNKKMEVITQLGNDFYDFLKDS